MANYKTPGVYVEEIPKFPPSVAQVETALPAFIGYTEKATDKDGTNLKLKPKRIGSLVEYEYFYGGAPKTIVEKVAIDDRNNFLNASARSEYYMYDSLRMFFANGGGDCYIVSINSYGVNAAVDDFKNGISALMTEDDPTILLFPDAVLMNDAAKLCSVQQAALMHCGDEARMDRVVIMDLLQSDTEPSEAGKAFRQNIGLNFLSYGMAYTPWIKTDISKKVTYGDIASKLFKNGAPATLDSLIPADEPKKAELTDDIDKLTKLGTDVTNISGNGFGSKSELFPVKIGEYNKTPGVAKFIDIVISLKEVFKVIDATAKSAVNPDLNTAIKNSVNTNFKLLFGRLIAVDKEAAADAEVKPNYTDAKITQAEITNAVWGNTFVSDVLASAFMTAADKIDKCNQAIAELQKVFDEVNHAYYIFIVDAATSLSNDSNNSLQNKLPVFKTIVDGVKTSVSLLPPSGAIAGVYALTDRTRGVWKAPANVSLNNVIAPSTIYTKSQLDNLNVDVNSGKSINAIRSFFGKGTLVYGARTLAGNDNEWRYIPVRRLFIMVEESTKKATEQFVFEPNDANTWVKVQAMIENFLYNVWRQGALQGIKPEHAFYVAVGLGKTMNPIDILEGRMIIEIGMAAVRPAEFIILRFSHKMAES